MRGHILDLRTNARDLVDEATAEFWTNAQIDRAANVAFAKVWSQIVSKGGDWAIRTDSIAVVSGTETYDLPDFVLRVRRVARVESDGAVKPLLPMVGMNDSFGLGRGASLGDPTGGTRWYLEGLSIGFRPKPTSAWTAQVKYVPTHPDFATGTAAAGASTTLTLDSAADPRDGYYEGCYVSLTGGTGSGQMRRISGYVGSTKVATVSAAWSTVPDATSVYAVHALVPDLCLPWALYETVTAMELKDEKARQELKVEAMECRKSALALLRQRATQRPRGVRRLDADNFV